MKRDFLLGRLGDESPARRRMEERLLLDPDFTAEMDAAEDDLIDDYVRGRLSAREREDFERYFLVTAERRESLAFAASFNARRTAPASAPPPGQSFWAKLRASLSPPLLPAYAKAAALAAVLIVVGLVAWRVIFRPAPTATAEGLAALRAAYARVRPVEARVTEMGYAELAETRGAEDERVDRQSLDLARVLLSRAPRGEPSAQHARGRLYLFERRPDEAVEQLDAAARTDPDDARLRSDLGAALLERGKEASRQQDYGKAAQDFALALEHLNRAVELDGTLADARFNRALVYEEQKVYAKAEQEWRDYLLKDPASPWAEEARRRLSRLEERRRRSALEQERRFREFEEAYRAGDAERAWAPLGRSRGRRGNLIVERLLDAHLGRVERGGAGAADALGMLAYAGQVEQEKTGDRFTSDLARFYRGASPAQLRAAALGRALMGEGYELFYKSSELDEALKVYAEARRAFEQAGDHCEALLAGQWEGFCHLRIPAPEKGTAAFKRMADVAGAAGYTALLAQSLQCLGDATGSADEPTQALGYADRAYEISRRIGYDENVARCMQFYTSMHRRHGRLDESLEQSLRGIALAEEAALDAKVAWTFYFEAGSTFYDKGLYGAALTFQEEALGLARESGWLFIIERSYARLSKVYLKINDFGKAVQVATTAVEQGRSIGRGRSRDNVVANALLELGEVYRGADEPARAVESYDGALALYEGLGLKVYDLKARLGKMLAYEALGDDGAAERELGLLLERLEEYRKKLREVRNRDSFFDAYQNVYDAAADFAYTRGGDAEAAFDYAERSHARTLLDLMRTDVEESEGLGGRDVRLPLTTEPLGLGEIRRRMPERTQILLYHVLDKKLLAWVVSRNGGFSHTEPVGREALKKKVEGYVKLLRDGGDPAAANAAAKELYAILVAPLEAALVSDAELCIVADKSLHGLPFAALVSPASGRYLLEERTLVHAPSASVFVVLSEAARGKARGAGESALSVGDPDFDRGEHPGLPPLPSAEREAREVAALYGARPLVGADAAEEEVTRGMRDAEVIQLASHYVIDSASPMRSRLLLARAGREPAGGGVDARDGSLQAFEVYRLKLPRARLVVLSACQTGGDRVYRGEGAVGIARPFLAAGAPLVVASLWPAESGPTADLMIAFHRRRRLDGLPTAEAFRRAQLDMLSSPDPRNRLPKHWAAFTVTGGHADF